MSWLERLASARLPWQSRHAAMPFTVHGGLALARNKPGLGKVDEPIDELPLPEQLIIPLLDYAKQAVKPCVNVNEVVRIGAKLGEGVIATANGIVAAIESRPVIHPSYREALSIVIDVDSVDEQSTQAFTPQDRLDIERLGQACIAGLGGAGFSTARKLQSANKAGHGIDTLIINAVECEPLISCDEALIRSDADTVAKAIGCMMQLSRCLRCIVAIESDKTQAIASLRKAIARRHDVEPATIELMELPPIYPSGAEKVLIQRVTGQMPLAGKHASDYALLCLNVATVVAAYRAQAGYPLVSRIITIGGSRAANAANVRVRIGTPIQHVLQHTGNWQAAETHRIRAGGPLSGFDLSDTAVPVTATTNCIAIEAPTTSNTPLACIRCSQCSDVCPVNLLPQQLHWFATSDDLQGAERFGLDSCIECGCCDVVCPSSIELTATFRYARTAQREQTHQKQQAELALQRYEKRQSREVTRKQQATLRREQKQAQLASQDDSIAATLARARARRKKS